MIRLALLALSCLAVGFSMSNHEHEHEWSAEELFPPERGGGWYELQECECGTFRMKPLPPGPASPMINA